MTGTSDSASGPRRAECGLLLAVAILAAGCATHGSDPAPGHTYRLYFLAGQSNMEGYGYNRELPPRLLAPQERVRIFTGEMVADNVATRDNGIWAALSPGHGTGFRSDGRTNALSPRFGPELAFGHAMAARDPEARIAIVKYAFGGTALAHGAGYGNWDPDSRDGHEPNQYDHALATLSRALSHRDIDGDGRWDALVPAGIVWMQGEADALDSPRTAGAYGANLKRLMDLLRAALRQDDLPVVIGKITDSGMDEDGQLMPYIATVQAAQAAFVANDSCASYVTVTESLGYLDDGWHYDTRGFLSLGDAFAQAALALAARCGTGP